MPAKLFISSLLVALSVVVSLAACGPASGSPDKTDAPAPSNPAPSPTPAPVTPNPAPSIKLALAKLNVAVTDPVFTTAPPGDNRLFVVERGGRIQVLVGGAVQPTPLLDISSRIGTDGERGLLSMAFDPQFATNSLFYIYFTEPNGSIAVERWRMSSTIANRADPASALRIITIAHPVNNNHNGGLAMFGLDNMLYLGIGDGGGAGDPNNNAQNLNSLLGKILRLDVRNATELAPYAVPADNPFFNQSGRRGEVWAYGLRNPWRFAFDKTTAQLIIADVGQDKREEIDAAPTNAGGLNYGWVVMEGTLCYSNAACDKSAYRAPVLDYDHGDNDVNGCSIIGGMVYRGSAIAELAGHYLYSDYCKAFLRSTVITDGKASTPVEWSIPAIGKIVSFGSDGQQEPYLITPTEIYKIVKQ